MTPTLRQLAEQLDAGLRTLPVGLSSFITGDVYG
jgi:hypothetical protein